MLAAPLETDGPAPPQSDEDLIIAHIRAHGFITGAEGPQVLGAVASHAEYILHTMKERGLLRLDDSGAGRALCFALAARSALPPIRAGCPDSARARDTE